MIGAILGGFTILGVFLTMAAWVNGRSIKKVLRELIAKIDERAEQRHGEVVKQFGKMDERAEQRHLEVVELLKRGFGGATA